MSNSTRQVQYYDLCKNWRKVKRHLNDPRVINTLVTDFNKFTYGRWQMEFTADQYPRQFETCMWDIGHRGRQPQFWNYVKHSACHWLVNFALELAQLVEPNRPWRIITSDEHSTVWDGKNTLFDFNFLALGIGPKECFKLAHKQEHRPGEHIEVHYANHFSHD